MASKPISEAMRSAFSAFAFAALVAASTTARADSIFDIFMPEADPYIVQNNIARWGFVQHSALARRGDVYLCDVADRNGAAQRLIIDAHSGRIIERFALRSYAAEEARRPDPRPRVESRDWGFPARPEVDVPLPVARPNVVAAYPSEVAPDYVRVPNKSQLAYGEGHAATPAPDARPVEKPRLKLAHPKHLPAPTASDLPQTATVAPSGADPAVQPPATRAPQPAPATPSPVAAKPAAPAATGVVASTVAGDVAAAKSPPTPQPAPASPPKTKAINDIPVAPLD